MVVYRGTALYAVPLLFMPATGRFACVPSLIKVRRDA
jgi:hypothetical protein